MLSKGLLQVKKRSFAPVGQPENPRTRLGGGCIGLYFAGKKFPPLVRPPALLFSVLRVSEVLSPYISWFTQLIRCIFLDFATQDIQQTNGAADDISAIYARNIMQEFQAFAVPEFTARLDRRFQSLEGQLHGQPIPYVREQLVDAAR